MFAIATAPDHALAVSLLGERRRRVRIWAKALAAEALLAAESELAEKGTSSADERGTVGSAFPHSGMRPPSLSAGSRRSASPGGQTHGSSRSSPVTRASVEARVRPKGQEAIYHPSATQFRW